MDFIRNKDFAQSAKQEIKYLNAGRGRGKSAALGLSIASALHYQTSQIYLTSASIENIRSVFEFIEWGLVALGHSKNKDFIINFDCNKNPKEVLFYQHYN